MMIKMLTRVQNIFLATKNIEETSRKFSTFFRGNPNFEGSSESLGIHINVFGLDKTNICLISPKNSGIWYEPLTNFLREKGEGIFGLNFSSDDVDSDYSNSKINDLEVSSRFNSAFQGNTNDAIDFNFFTIVNESVINLNISISNEINFLSRGESITDGISKVNQLVIQTKKNLKKYYTKNHQQFQQMFHKIFMIFKKCLPETFTHLIPKVALHLRKI